MLYTTSFSQVQVTLDPETQHQLIEGFGAHGSMNVWWSGGPFYNNNFLDLVVDDLGLTINRNNYYPDGEHFDNKQKNWIIALKNKADGSGEPIKFITTYWSPPGRWKDNNDNLNGGSVLPQYYDELADYCVNTVNVYKNECDVDLFALSIANEPRFAQTFNSCVWDPVEYAKALDMAGDALENAGKSTRLFGAEDMGSYSVNAAWFDAILDENIDSRNHMDAWAVHSYQDGVAADYGSAAGWEAMYDAANEYDKQLWMTETSGYLHSNWNDAFTLSKSIYLALKYGKISAWVWWQLCEQPHPNPDDDKYTLMLNEQPTKLYYISKHYYRYIRPGAFQISCSSDDTEVLSAAFKHPDEARITVILINNASSQKTVNLDMGSYSLPGQFRVYRTTSGLDCADQGTVSNNTFNLPGESVNTLVFEGINNGPTMSHVSDMMVLHDAGQQSVELTGITDGGEGGQTISINATSSNPAVIPNPTITYTSPNNTATLNFTPQNGQQGELTITISATDDGDATGNLNQTYRVFNVKVLPFINAAPTLDNVNDFNAYIDDGQQTIMIGGLSDGNDGSQVLSVDGEAAVPQALQVAPVIDGNAIKFYYIPKLKGDIPVTIKITDDGGIEMDGEDTKTISFTVSIKEGSNPDSITDTIPDPILVNEYENGYCIYPVPAENTIHIHNTGKTINNLTIIDLNGRYCIRKNNLAGEDINVDVSGLSDGIYVLKLYNNNRIVGTEKIVVK